MSQATPKQARRFYWIIGTVLTVYATLAWRNGHFTRSKVMVGVALTLLCIHYVLPGLSLSLFQLNQRLLSKLGSFLTKLFLILFFYVIFTPYGVLIRLFQKDPLQRALEPKRTSYWIPRGNPETQGKECENPY